MISEFPKVINRGIRICRRKVQCTAGN